MNFNTLYTRHIDILIYLRIYLVFVTLSKDQREKFFKFYKILTFSKDDNAMRIVTGTLVIGAMYERNTFRFWRIANKASQMKFQFPNLGLNNKCPQFSVFISLLLFYFVCVCVWYVEKSMHKCITKHALGSNKDLSILPFPHSQHISM